MALILKMNEFLEVKITHCDHRQFISRLQFPTFDFMLTGENVVKNFENKNGTCKLLIKSSCEINLNFKTFSCTEIHSFLTRENSNIK